MDVDPLGHLLAHGEYADPPSLLARIVAGAGDRIGVDVRALPLQLWVLAGDVGAAVDLSGHALDDLPDMVGALHERLIDPKSRSRRGAFYTPRLVAERLSAIALAGTDRPRRPVVLDPACGGGVFLLAAARALAVEGLDRREIVTELLAGVDLDPLAVAVTEAALALWSALDGRAAVADRLVVGDALVDLFEPDGTVVGGTYDVVVGNPPFQGQLDLLTVRSRATAAELASRHGTVAAGYTDASAVFLAASCRLARPGGRVALVQPQSVLSAQWAGAARREVTARGSLAGMWFSAEPVFDAGVRVCAPVIDVGAEPAPVRRWSGPTVEPAGTAPPPGGSWAAVVADLIGCPRVRLHPAGALAQLGVATAGFRQHFYGLVPHVVDQADPSCGFAPLVTTGLIDPARSWWGQRSTRFAKRRFGAPSVDLSGLGADRPDVAEWFEARRATKILVATQTRVIEAVADPIGALLPSVPVISLHCDESDLWHALAVLLAPAVSAFALAERLGGALSVDAIKLSARQVGELPLPPHRRWWDRGAELARRASIASDDGERTSELAELGAQMDAAYGVDDGVGLWWRSRWPEGLRSVA